MKLTNLQRACVLTGPDWALLSSALCEAESQRLYDAEEGRHSDPEQARADRGMALAYVRLQRKLGFLP